MTRERSWLIETGETISAVLTESELRTMNVEKQYDFMRQWFLSHYENPMYAGRPYEDGEFVFYFGGPFYPDQELTNEFEEIVPYDIIEKLASEFSDQCHEWDMRDKGTYLQWISPNSAYYRAFLQSFDDVRALLTMPVPPEYELVYCKMLYANVITVMETYLADAFITNTMDDAANVRRFVKSTPEYKETKFSLADVYEQMDRINTRVQETLHGVMWHNVAKVTSMYRATLGVDVRPPSAIFSAVAIRHDIVHRNGFNKTGEHTNVSRDDVSQLVDEVFNFIELINTQLVNKNA